MLQRARSSLPDGERSRRQARLGVAAEVDARATLAGARRSAARRAAAVLEQPQAVLDLGEPELELLVLAPRDEPELAEDARRASSSARSLTRVASPRQRPVTSSTIVARLLAAHLAALDELVDELLGSLLRERDGADAREEELLRRSRARAARSCYRARPCGLARRRLRRASRRAAAAAPSRRCRPARRRLATAAPARRAPARPRQRPPRRRPSSALADLELLLRARRPCASRTRARAP